jgi:hypothetical protein
MTIITRFNPKTSVWATRRLVHAQGLLAGMHSL